MAHTPASIAAEILEIDKKYGHSKNVQQQVDTIDQLIEGGELDGRTWEQRKTKAIELLTNLRKSLGLETTQKESS